MELFSRGHALVIGVGLYDDRTWCVPIAAQDAQGIYATLIDPQLAAYPPGHCELLRDDQASRAGVLAALTRLADRARPEDVVLISFTGHGAMGDDKHYYLGTRETQFNPDQTIRKGTGLTEAELARALRAIQARQVLLVANACFSGHLGDSLVHGNIAAESPYHDPEEALPAGAVLPTAYSDDLLATGEGRAIITASRSGQRSHFRRDREHSFFGQAMIDALRGSAVPAQSGYIGLFELYSSIYRQIKNVTAQRGYDQDPVLNLVEGIGPFPVARYPGATHADERQLQQTPPAGAVRQTQVTIGKLNVINAGTVIGPDAQVGDVIIGDQGKQDLIKGSMIGGSASQKVVDSLLESSSRLLEKLTPPPIIIPPFDELQAPTGGGGPLINFGNNNAFGSVEIGDVVGGNLIKSGIGPADADDAPEPPAAALRKIQGRVATARNVDEDARDEAVLRLQQAARAAEQGDNAKARQRIGEALSLLDAMQNGFITSLTRKLRAVLGELAE